MAENEISAEVVDAALLVHRELGPGLVESVYEVILVDELERRGLRCEPPGNVPVTWRGKTFEPGFRADVIVNAKVLLELKSVKELAHPKQVLTYLKLLNMRLGLLINFGEALLKNGLRRVVNGLDESPPRA